ncbi:MAG TPA: methyltransferase [Desulfobacteraceae bacterium]|nr:methyltransferase [Desulfobacteraceae bacterium]|tara:strand:+ start:638 stop:1951 length:1314 start_codon:yes stop_codon:yes gene_type:complete
MKNETGDLHSEDLQRRFTTYFTAHRNGRLEEAEAGYEKLLKEQPDWGRVLSALGNLYLDQGLPEKAKPVFEKAAGLNPPDLSACYNLGRLLQMDADHAGAIDLYKRMLEAQPAIGPAWNNLGVAYRETGQQDKAMESFLTAVRFAPDMAEAWNNLGVAQDEQDLADKAMASYKKAIEIKPAYASPHLNLGILLQKKKQFQAAETHYTEVLRLQPDNEIANFMRHSIKGDKPPDAAPVEHVRSIFDQCAENFETILVEDLAYKTPERLFDLVRPCLTEKMRILDLGCGTGLGAALYRPFAAHLTGVDVSAKMLEKALKKNIYDRLEMFDVLKEWTFPEKFHLIYSSDVFVYFGNLDRIISSASAYLVSGGTLAFSVEELQDDATDYKLYPSGRYAHTQAYIDACLSRHGLRIKEIRRTDIRTQSGTPVKGLLIVAVKA